VILKPIEFKPFGRTSKYSYYGIRFYPIGENEEKDEKK